MLDPAPARHRISRTVWALGFVSLFMDVSSEIVHALLPLFLTVTLGASVALVGLIDGLAEATASFAKVFSGYLSDRTGKRKPLILLGYGLGALSKPLFALAPSAGLVLAARIADRIGKGIRGAPRDALIADVTPQALRGRAFGLRQSLDTAGAFVGPLLALGLMVLFDGDMRLVFAAAAVPGAIAVLLVLTSVRDHKDGGEQSERPQPLRLREVAELDRRFWGVAAIGGLFTLARFSEAFLVLKASEAGLPAAFAPLVLVAMNAVYSLGAYPAGVLSDRIAARPTLLWGLVPLILADLTLAMTAGLLGAFAGIALWGMHMALTQGLMAKLVADRAPPALRGSAFGIFHLVSGIALLAGNLAAGLLWSAGGSPATFYGGAAVAGAAFLLLAIPARPSPAAAAPPDGSRQP